jgi:hypothetical protein
MSEENTHLYVSHCVTCECNDPSSLAVFNLRCTRLMRERPLDISMISADRLSASEKYRFGFREWMPSMGSTSIVASFLAAIHPGRQPTLTQFEQLVGDHPDIRDIGYRSAEAAWREGTRYFGVLVPPFNVSDPRPFEYHMGDAFDINGAQIWLEGIERLSALSDDAVANWLDRSRIWLRDYVVEQLAAKRS